MGEIFGQVAFSVAVLIIAICEVSIAVEANVLTFHTRMLTFNLHIAFVA